jgi:Ser-tRNA(Ala) deacylase AlaX
MERRFREGSHLRAFEAEVTASSEAGELRHHLGRELAPGTAVRGELDRGWRHALMRAHALMRVVNTVARDRYGAAITGVPLGAPRTTEEYQQLARGLRTSSSASWGEVE